MVSKYVWQSAIIAFVLPTIYVIWELYTGASVTDAFIDAIGCYCMVPITVVCAYMWFGDNPSCGLNMPSKLPPEELERFARYYGVFAVIASILMSCGIALLLNGEFLWGLIITIAPIALFIYPCRYLNKGVAGKHIPLEGVGGGKRLLATVGIAVLAFAPFLVSDGLVNEDGVSIEWGEESFTVKAPMFDHTFRYDDIVECEYDADFDKGIRKWGYGTSEICSGRFNNSDFGDYELASYTKVDPCIIISVGGQIYAFNQHDVASTESAYQTLLQKLS